MTGGFYAWEAEGSLRGTVIGGFYFMGGAMNGLWTEQ
jgi:hypothetical protein